jgi:glycosyltransferase involved in cell wall biosynthesis
MTNRPTVSVLLPAYNAGPGLGAAVRSILTQTFSDFEILLVDDGSTDWSVNALLAQPAGKDPRLRLLRQSNKGLAAALNAGLEKARGDLIARMDADDIAHPDRLARQVAVMTADGETALLGGQIRRVSSGRALSTTSFPIDHDAIVSGLLRRAHVLSHPSVMYRAAEARDLGGYWDYGVSEDWDFFLRISQRGRLANLRSVVLDYSYDTQGINATQLHAVRRNMRFAIANYQRRRQGATEISLENFVRSLDLSQRVGIRLETQSLVHYRRALSAKADGRLAVALVEFCATGAFWPRQALRRIGVRFWQLP